MIGIGLRPQHYSYVLTHQPPINFFEIISENFIGLPQRPMEVLEQVRSRYPIAMHGVSLSIGSMEPIRKDYLRGLKELIDAVDPFIVSDHLCWTRYGAHNSHDLLPVPLTHTALNHIASRIDHVQDFLGRSILLENASVYVAFAADQMNEATFLQELTKRTGCRILLDVNNLQVNADNLGWNGLEYLQTIPRAAVGQFHLAGPSRCGNAWIDTHDHPVREETWHLYRQAQEFFPGCPILIEWDDQIPDFETLLGEAQKAQQLWIPASEPLESAPYKRFRPDNLSSPSYEIKAQQDFMQGLPPSQESQLEQFAARYLKAGALAEPCRGYSIYHNAYFLRLESVLAETFPLMVKIMERENFAQVCADFCNQFLPRADSVTDFGAYFPEYFEETKELSVDFGIESSFFADLARFEWAQTQVFLARKQRHVTVDELSEEQGMGRTIQLSPTWQILNSRWDIVAIADAFREDREPDLPEPSPCPIAVYYQNGKTFYERIPELTIKIADLCKSSATLTDIMQQLQHEADLPAIANQLVHLTKLGFLIRGLK